MGPARRRRQKGPASEELATNSLHPKDNSAWRQLRAPPPLTIGPKQWEAARKLFPHESTQGPPPLREGCDPQAWHPTMQQFMSPAAHPAMDHQQGWLPPHPTLEDVALSTITLVCLDKGQGRVRPILIGVLWTKVLSHLLLAQARPDLDLHLEDRQYSMPDMTGRPGCQTMEIFGGSTASYLARTPRIPLFEFIFIGLETKNVLDYQGRAGSTSIVQWTLRPVIFGVEIWDWHPRGWPWPCRGTDVFFC